MQEHDIELKFYCETCKELVCLYCTVKDHSTHSHDAIKEVAGKHREKLKKTTASLKYMIEKLSFLHGSISEAKKRMLEQHKCIDQEVDAYFDKMVQKMTDEVNKQRQELKQDLLNKVTSKVAVLTSQLDNVEEVQVNMNITDTLARELEESSSDEILSGEQQVLCRVSEMTDTFNKLKTDPIEFHLPYFIPSCPDTLLRFGGICDVSPLQCEIMDFPIKVMQDCTVQFTVTAKDARGINFTAQLEYPRDGSNSVALKDNNNGSYTGSFMVKLVGHHQLSVNIKGRQIKGCPYSFFVSKNFSKLNYFSKSINSKGKIGGPWGVACSSNHHLAVSDNTKHCVYIFNQDNQLVKEFGCRGSGTSQFLDPCGLSFDSNNCLYVVDGGNRRVQKFNLNSEYLLQFGNKGTPLEQLSDPIGITVHLDKVYITDRGSQQISIYQTDGTYCFSFGSRGSGLGQFENPWDVAITPDDTMCVVDVANARIQLFQLDGTFINSFGSIGSGKGQLTFPSSIAIDPNGFILITEITNNRISVFDKQQNCLHTFNSQAPREIAISHTGTIYVGNYKNSRITMYL